MDFHKMLGNWLADDRVVAHLIAIHVVLGIVLLVSYILRKLLMRGVSQLMRWTGLHQLEGFSHEATRRLRLAAFWFTLVLMALVVVGGISYHYAGRDVRHDVHQWYSQLSAGEIFAFGLTVAELVLLSVALFVVIRLFKRARIILESYALQRLPHRFPPAVAIQAAADKTVSEQEHKERHQHTVKHWFHVLERFVLSSIVLGAFWIAGHIVHLAKQADVGIGFVLRLMAIIMVSRLLILGCRTLAHALAELGNHHLGSSKFKRYWEQVLRLFPFGEKCFEAAVYISAATLCVLELNFIKVVAVTGPHVVQCIGIFFLTRVVIELTTVLLNEAFGMYAEDRPVDQKGQTLVPLLQSICQYVLYFGCGLLMLSVMEISTQPILAAAGILGLAGGLGAQSLVTDVVSGFFILFENQYLVGDIVQICDAQGRVEAVSIRHTQVRDEQGKLYIIPNGQIKSVVNYSKGYVNAVVDIKMPASTPVDQVLHDMAEAGNRLRKTHREVLADTIVKGLVDLSPGDMTIRAVTRVQPGTHRAMENEYRRILKAVFDEKENKPVSLAA